jgi:hypothetical protein
MISTDQGAVQVARYTYAEIIDIAAWASEGLPPAAAEIARTVISETMTGLNQINEQIAGSLWIIESATEKVRRALAAEIPAHLSLNELGEFQNAGMIDTYIARRAQLQRTLALLTRSSSCPLPGEFLARKHADQLKAAADRLDAGSQA